MRKITLAAVVMAACSLALAGTAQAQTRTVSGSVGPVAVPNVPVQVCVGTTCQNAPALSTVGLAVTASADAGGALPTITPSSCSSGSGAVLVVKGGSTATTVGGTVNGTLSNGSAFTQPIGPVTVAPNGTTTVGACTTTAPGLPVPVPGLPSLPSPAGLLGLILNLVTSLLGGLPGLPL